MEMDQEKRSMSKRECEDSCEGIPMLHGGLECYILCDKEKRSLTKSECEESCNKFYNVGGMHKCFMKCSDLG